MNTLTVDAYRPPSRARDRARATASACAAGTVCTRDVRYSSARLKGPLSASALDSGLASSSSENEMLV